MNYLNVVELVRVWSRVVFTSQRATTVCVPDDTPAPQQRILKKTNAKNFAPRSQKKKLLQNDFCFCYCLFRGTNYWYNSCVVLFVLLRQHAILLFCFIVATIAWWLIFIGVCLLLSGSSPARFCRRCARRRCCLTTGLEPCGARAVGVAVPVLCVRHCLRVCAATHRDLHSHFFASSLPVRRPGAPIWLQNRH